MANTDAIKQYNAAVRDINSALEAVNAAKTDEERSAAQAKFNEAQAEAERCQHNVENAETAQRFKPMPVENPNELGLDGKEVRSYSLVRAINAAATGNWKGAEFERECSEEIAKRSGKTPAGFFVPTDVQRMQRDLSGVTATAGAELVATNLLTGSFIDLLRNKMVVKQAGATVLSDLVGNIAIPRQTGGGTFYWVGADGAPTESEQAFDQVTMTPKVGGAFTDIGRSLLKQTSMDVEAMVVNDLATICALGIDFAALNGVGTAESKDPKGVANITGIGSVAGGDNGAVPTFGNIIDLETAVAAANADLGRLGYITNAKVRGKLKQTPKVTGYPDFIWANDNTLNGYNALVSNQVPSNLVKGTSGTKCSQIFFGNWADLIIGQWGTLDILVDPYTGGGAGTVRIRALQDVDVCVRHAASFALMADALTA